MTASTRLLVALGGNLGDRRGILREAAAELAATAGIRLIAASSLYETPALTTHGIDASAPPYLNAVLSADSELSPPVLLRLLQSIESRHGRQRGERWASRTLDLDLIDVGGLRFETPELQLPHPRAWQRAFVLAPWLEIEPDARLAGHGRVAGLLEQARDPVTRLNEGLLDEPGDRT